MPTPGVIRFRAPKRREARGTGQARPLRVRRTDAGACDDPLGIAVDPRTGLGVGGLLARGKAGLDHDLVEMSNAGATCPYEQEGQQRVHKACHPTHQHRHREARRLEHVFPIGLANLVEVVGEKRHFGTPPAGSDDVKLPDAEAMRLEDIS